MRRPGISRLLAYFHSTAASARRRGSLGKKIDIFFAIGEVLAVIMIRGVMVMRVVIMVGMMVMRVLIMMIVMIVIFIFYLFLYNFINLFIFQEHMNLLLLLFSRLRILGFG